MITVIVGDRYSNIKRTLTLFENLFQKLNEAKSYKYGLIIQSLTKRNMKINLLFQHSYDGDLNHINCVYLSNLSDMIHFFSNIHLEFVEQYDVIAIDDPDEICGFLNNSLSNEEKFSLYERKRNIAVVMILFGLIFNEILSNSKERTLILNLNETGIFAKYLLSSQSPYLIFPKTIIRIKKNNNKDDENF